MVKTYLIPFMPMEAVIIVMDTTRDLTKEESRKLCDAYRNVGTPYEKLKSLDLLVDELKRQGEYSLADLIIT